MSYRPAKFPVLILRHPFTAGAIVLGVGICGGTAFQALFGDNFVERFGALSVALGTFLFGTVTSELMVRGQAMLIVGQDGEPDEPFKLRRIRRTLIVQAAVVALGTIQWGFGSLMFNFVEDL
jgi:hypothetical protein